MYSKQVRVRRGLDWIFRTRVGNRLRSLYLCIHSVAQMSLYDENAVSGCTYQLTTAVHKPLPSAFHSSFLLVITPPPFPSLHLPTSFLPSSPRYFID